jgi:hypothetical protein
VITIGWASTVMALLTLWVLSWTPNGPGSLGLLVFLLVFAGLAVWAFCGRRAGAQR